MDGPERQELVIPLPAMTVVERKGKKGIQTAGSRASPYALKLRMAPKAWRDFEDQQIIMIDVSIMQPGQAGNAHATPYIKKQRPTMDG